MTIKLPFPIEWPDVDKISQGYIDNNFYRITRKTAQELCSKWGLPRFGYFMPVEFDGFHCEIHRTPVRDKDGIPTLVWAIMITSRKVDRVQAKNPA